MQHYNSSSSSSYKRTISHGSLTDASFSEKQKLTESIRQQHDLESRREAEYNLLQMGRYMQDVLNSVGESSIFKDVQVSNAFTHYLIRDWSFFDERYIAGEGILKHIDSQLIRAMPELESIATWVYTFMVPFIKHPLDIEQIQNLHLIPNSKLSKATYNKESAESFAYTIKYPHELPSAPPTLVLEAHPFILYKFNTIKLYFITENNILIDFFFWHVPAASQ